MQFSALDGGNAEIDGVTVEADIVAAPAATHRIIVLGFMLTLDAAGDYFFGSASVSLMGSQSVGASVPAGAFCGAGIFRCEPGEALTLTSTQAANGWVRYVIARA